MAHSEWTDSVTVKSKKLNFELSIFESKFILKRNVKNDAETIELPPSKIVNFGFSDKMDKPLVTLFYINQRYNFKWKMEKLEFDLDSQDRAKKWLETVDNFMKEERARRPKKLLVLVNPQSGHLKGETIYRKEAEPVFQAASIECDVTITTDGDHPRRVIESTDFSSIDGIVAVGGDGTFSLVYNAVFAKEMREDGLNPDTDLPNPMRMPVAGLPGGTGNAISKCATATYCAETYALYIVCGLTSPLPVCQVLIGGKHERFNNIFSGCGSSSRAFMYGEQKRQSWGAGRLIYGMFKTLKENKNLEMKVDYLPLDSNNWETLSGPYLNVEMYAYAFDKGTRLTYWPDGPAVNGFNLALSRPASRWQQIKQVKRMINFGSDMFNAPFLDFHKVTEAKYSLLNESDIESEVLHIDGDVVKLNAPNVHLRYIGNVLKIFGAFDRIVEINPQATIDKMAVLVFNKNKYK